MGKAELYACALPQEAKVLKRHGPTKVVGMGCCALESANLDRPFVFCGYGGGLDPTLQTGDGVSATKVIYLTNGRIETIWEGEPIRIRGAKYGIVLGSDEIVDDPLKRRWLHEKTRAIAIDMESHLAAKDNPLYRGSFRAMTDTVRDPMGRQLSKALNWDGTYNRAQIRRAFTNDPWGSLRFAYQTTKANITLFTMKHE